MANIQKSNTSLVEGSQALLSEEITIFLLDTSGSMYDRISSDSFASKIDALKTAAQNFVHQRIQAVRNGANDKVGVIVFGDFVKVLHDPSSTNFERLISTIGNIRANGGTPMAAAVTQAIALSERFTTGMIRVIICSDGFPDYKDEVIRAVRNGFDNYGIIFDTIGIGSEGRYYSLDEEFMKFVAEIGGGEYTRISTAEELLSKFLLIESERQLLLGNGILLLPE